MEALNEDDQTTIAQQQTNLEATRLKPNELEMDLLEKNATDVVNSPKPLQSIEANKDDSSLNDVQLPLDDDNGQEFENNHQQQQQRSTAASPMAEHSTIGGDPNSPSTDLSEPPSDQPDEDIGSEKTQDSAIDNLSQQERSNQSSKSGQDNNNQESASLIDGEATSSALGRNRRVRQKNRYFLDFHCIDLTKGGRSKEDFSYSPAANIRTTTRRSTTDSNRGPQDDPDVSVETKYCRKCLSRTAHDFDGGCQVCLYKKIVSSSKRQRSSSQRNRSSTTRQQQKQNQHDNEILSSTITTTTIVNKRKATKQAGGPTKLNNNISANIQALNDDGLVNGSVESDNKLLKDYNVRDIITLAATTTSNNHSDLDQNNILSNVCKYAERTSPFSTLATTSTDLNASTKTSTNETIECQDNKLKPKIKSEFNNEVVHYASIGSPEFPQIDSWTPEEVANFVMSRGFTDEAESFKSQSVDGISLLLMQRTDFTCGLKLKLGPALKIYDQVCKLKKDYFRRLSPATS